MAKRMIKAERRKLTKEHIKHLLVEAAKIFGKDPAKAHAYAKDIRRSAMKVNLSLPSEQKRRICRKCNHFLVPGRNCRVRTTRHRVVMTCTDCGNISRYGFLREQKAKRKRI